MNDRGNALNRVLVLPKGRPVEIQLGSRDVIHDFFLPNFRTKLDVVPGMRGKLYITADSDCPGPQLYTLDELQGLIDSHKDMMALVNENTPGAIYNPGHRHAKFWRLAKDDFLLVDGALITADVIKSAKAAGVAKISRDNHVRYSLRRAVRNRPCDNGGKGDRAGRRHARAAAVQQLFPRRAPRSHGHGNARGVGPIGSTSGSTSAVGPAVGPASRAGLFSFRTALVPLGSRDLLKRLQSRSARGTY